MKHIVKDSNYLQLLSFFHTWRYNNVSDGALFLEKVPKKLQVGSVGKKM